MLIAILITVLVAIVIAFLLAFSHCQAACSSHHSEPFRSTMPCLMSDQWVPYWTRARRCGRVSASPAPVSRAVRGRRLPRLRLLGGELFADPGREEEPR